MSSNLFLKKLLTTTTLIIGIGLNSIYAQQDSLANLFRNSYSVFELLRNEKGIYRDSKVFNGADFHPSSVASIGMGLISICIAEEMGWIEDGEAKVIMTLKSILGNNPPFQLDRNASGYFRHWVDMNTGIRAWNSEYSTIDSGILVSGALFCRRYFCGNAEISELATRLWQSIDWSKAIQDSAMGGIYLEMLENGEGKSNSVTLPFNEYMIVAWLAMNQEKENGITGKAMELWQNHFANSNDLPTKFYEGTPVLTDSPNHFLSSFVSQFPYYLCHYFTANHGYLDFFKNARKADRAWWANQSIANEEHWGLGAGSADNGSGYLATAINNNNSRIFSPHIIAGFLPIAPEDTTNLINLYRNRQGLYTLPKAQHNQILWRKSLTNPAWSAPEVQGVDYSTMLFGLATLPRFLGIDFFKTHNDFFGIPCNQLTTSSSIEKEKLKLTIFPNPTQTNIQLLLENNKLGVLTVKLLNSQGDILISKKHQKLSSVFRTSFDLSNFAAGIYFVSIIQEGSMEVQKIIIN